MKLLNYLLDLIYPNLCVVCGESLLRDEKELCLKCLSGLPRTNFHNQKDNLVEQRFWYKVKVERGTAFFFFRKGSVYQKLLHQLKYKKNKSVGYRLGELAGFDLLESEDFKSIDCIIPVPLHRKKLLKRGYNQSEVICRGLSKVLKKPVIKNNLIRTKDSETQTRKSVFARYENVKDIFQIRKPKKIENKHILLVDDVLTTGSTLEGCVSSLNKVKGVKVSIFTLALAVLD